MDVTGKFARRLARLARLVRDEAKPGFWKINIVQQGLVNVLVLGILKDSLILKCGYTRKLKGQLRNFI